MISCHRNIFISWALDFLSPPVKACAAYFLSLGSWLMLIYCHLSYLKTKHLVTKVNMRTKQRKQQQLKVAERSEGNSVQGCQLWRSIQDIHTLFNLSVLCVFVCVSPSEDSLSPGGLKGPSGAPSSIPTPITVPPALCHSETHTHTQSDIITKLT